MRKGWAVLISGLAVLAAAEPAAAVSAFARRYGVRCHFCHDGYPKLNAVGQRFKERGFRMENEGDFDADAWLRSVPVTVRPQVNRFFIEDGDGTTTGYVKVIAPGNLGGRLAYWVDDAVLITEGDDNFRHVEPDNAWARVEIVPEGKLYVRAGRIELDLPFTQARTPHLLPYEIYFANTGFETDSLGFHQEGVEVGGDLPGDGRWSAAVVSGHDSAEMEALSDDVDDFEANVYLRASRRLERHRIGAFAYLGRNTLATTVPGVGAQGPAVLVWDDDLLRLGVDASVWVDRLNLYGLYMYGRNDNSIADRANPSGTGESLSFSGGFVQADLHLRDWMALTARLNVVSRPPGRSAGSRETLSSVFPGIKLWALERIKLSFEYGFHNQDRPNFGAVQAELVL